MASCVFPAAVGPAKTTTFFLEEALEPVPKLCAPRRTLLAWEPTEN